VSIALYASDVGRAGEENKYELPPPVDTPLYFGKLVLTASHGDAPADLKPALWTAVREKLFGGFEDIGDASEESEEELVPEELQTKHGYMRDGFVVDDSGGEGEDEDEDDSELSTEEYVSETDDAGTDGE